MVCGTCHALNADLFASSPHKGAFDAQKLPECETCHSNHGIMPATDAMLGTGSDAVCSRCHTRGVNTSGYVAAGHMRAMMDSLALLQHQADSLVSDAEQKGMEVSEDRFKLRDVTQAKLQSRTAIHSFNEAKFREVVGKGISVATLVGTDGKAAIDEFYFRRKGLGIASLIITIVALSLYAAIRRIEARQREDNHHSA
jgi:predicted CXXCH cytochrome family protein